MMENPSKDVKDFFSDKRSVADYSKIKLRSFEKELFRIYLKNKGRLLDVCCGAGRVAIPLAKKGFNVVGVDFSSNMIRNAKKIAKKRNIKNVKFILCDASSMNFKKQTFNYVIMMDISLCHIYPENKRKIVVEKIYNYLKSDGILIISFLPTIFILPLRTFIHNLLFILGYKNQKFKLNEIYFKVYNKKVYCKLFTFQEIKKLLKSLGFKEIKIMSSRELAEKNKSIKFIYNLLKPFFPCCVIAIK